MQEKEREKERNEKGKKRKGKKRRREKRKEFIFSLWFGSQGFLLLRLRGESEEGEPSFKEVLACVEEDVLVILSKGDSIDSVSG